ncbi:Uncharacterized protein APZ42_000255 [Daphnia magna]|uniref:Uncharacterized protein n=1 Tax=Daphnia magna TaxID=35525 RepID=A0A164JT45_9CRUS|nr:Uncharacterized protein APZ42_000255 [Daphnia magna]
MQRFLISCLIFKSISIKRIHTNTFSFLSTKTVFIQKIFEVLFP